MTCGARLCQLQECKLLALQQMVQRFAQIVDKVTWVTPDSPQDDDAVNAVATLYHNKAHGQCGSGSASCTLWPLYGMAQ